MIDGDCRAGRREEAHAEGVEHQNAGVHADDDPGENRSEPDGNERDGHVLPVLDGVRRADVEEDVTHHASAQAGQHAHDGYPEQVETFANSDHRTRSREDQNSGEVENRLQHERTVTPSQSLERELRVVPTGIEPVTFRV